MIDLATLTLQDVELRGGRPHCSRATMRTVLAAKKHHSEARRTGDGCELRFAVLTLRSIARDRGATIRAIKSLGFHQSSQSVLTATFPQTTPARSRWHRSNHDVRRRRPDNCSASWKKPDARPRPWLHSPTTTRRN